VPFSSLAPALSTIDTRSSPAGPSSASPWAASGVFPPRPPSRTFPSSFAASARAFLQQGYAEGYLIAAIINLYLVPKTSWRSLFWTVAGFSTFDAFIRVLTPESEFFLKGQEAERHRIAEGGAPRTNKTRVSLRKTK
jgi:MFS family permease